MTGYPEVMSYANIAEDGESVTAINILAIVFSSIAVLIAVHTIRLTRKQADGQY